MNRKRTLRVCVTIGFLTGAVAFAVVFIQGLFGPGLNSGNVLDLRGIGLGAARLESWDGKPVWIVHRSEEQLLALSSLSAYVAPPSSADPPHIDNTHRSLQRRYGVYLAQTDRIGILVQYTSQRPDGLGPDTPWHGGFVDPAGDAVFDLAGRRYRNTQGEPLAVPPQRFEDQGVMKLGEW